METEKLALAFELTGDSWLTLPRCLMGAMTPEWQDRMASLMEEFRTAWPGLEEVQTRVVVVRECAWCDGTGWRDKENEEECAVCEGQKVNVSATFEFLHDYRRPDFKRIAQLTFEPKHLPSHSDFQAALARVRHNPAFIIGVDLASGPDQTIKHVVSTTEE